MSKQEWWRDFFRGLAVDLWLGIEDSIPTPAEVDFIEQTLELPANGRVLDVPCGGGRHSIVLARRGYRVTSVDFSARFLITARTRAADTGLDVNWQQRDMRDLPWPAAFAGAFSFGNSFGYFDDNGNAAFLEAVAGALKPGARFIIDTGAIAESLLPHMETRTWFRGGDTQMLIENRYDVDTGRLYTDYTFIRDGQSEERTGFQRVYTYREFCVLLEQAGFANLKGYRSLDRAPYELGAQRLLMVATRR